MPAPPRISIFVLAIVLACVAACAHVREEAPAVYTPAVGQKGKDVVWVPTPQVLVDRMLDMAKVTRADYLIDLGSGDGRTVITAARRGVRALGIEYDAEMVALSRRNAREAGVAGRAEFVKADLFETDLSQATVITLFLLPELNLKLRPRLLALEPGTRVVSNSFDMGDWEPDERADLDASHGCENSWCTALLWIVPAQVAGTHRTPHGELVLTQHFQRVYGTLRSSGQEVPVEGKVVGAEVFLNAAGRPLRGQASGRQLQLR